MSVYAVFVVLGVIGLAAILLDRRNDRRMRHTERSTHLMMCMAWNMQALQRELAEVLRPALQEAVTKLAAFARVVAG